MSLFSTFETALRTLQYSNSHTILYNKLQITNYNVKLQNRREINFILKLFRK
jgi:hypothetical protein